ncbi:MAG: hypothetical protein ABI867_36345 [Kofleriaceae bacterium]
MFPTMVVGLILVAVAVRFALAPDRRRLRVIVGMSALTLLGGMLGTVAGCIKSFTAFEGAGDLAIVGMGESLNNFALGLGMVVLSTIITTIGLARAGTATPARRADLTDPLAP